jgi:hypothetical protein|tara:strand:+ start:1338 stop:1592 length:255 start_codon:yes stop_codon:yes gene_type:complete
MSRTKKVYFEEVTQKVRWTQTTTDKFQYNYKYIGVASEAEFDLLLELLWFLYEDDNISFNEFFDTYKELRDFCDEIKGLIDKPE